MGVVRLSWNPATHYTSEIAAANRRWDFHEVSILCHLHPSSFTAVSYPQMQTPESPPPQTDLPLKEPSWRGRIFKRKEKMLIIIKGQKATSHPTPQKVLSSFFIILRAFLQSRKIRILGPQIHIFSPNMLPKHLCFCSFSCSVNPWEFKRQRKCLTFTVLSPPQESRYFLC